MTIKFTLVTDGSSDNALVPILVWLCRQHIEDAIEGQWFDPRPFAPPSLSLPERIDRSIKLFPCDVLFIHRDAENAGREKRLSEIADALESLPDIEENAPCICVIPVRMTEAWLLFDETAIRRAAGNPNGKMKLDLPSIREADQVPDPKKLLFQALEAASGLGKRRRKKLNLSVCRHRVAELAKDFSPLRDLDAFRRMETDIRQLPFAKRQLRTGR